MGRADLPLKINTWYLLLVYFAWFACTVAYVSLSESSIPGFNAVSSVNQYHYLHYGTMGVITFFTVFGCWLAAYHQTRQLRALALTATTINTFSFFIYIRWTLQGLSSSRNCGLPVSAGGVPLPSGYCDLQLATSILSVLFEAGVFSLWCWSLYRFIQLRNVEPFCELDKSEIEMEQRKQAGLIPQQQNLAPIAQLGNNNVNHNNNTMNTTSNMMTNQPQSVHVQSTPAGLVESEAPLGTNQLAGRRITTFAEQRLSLPSMLNLFFIALTICGFIITVIPNIQLGRMDYQDDTGVVPPTGFFGNNPLNQNLIFLTLTLLFSLSFGAMMSYDRLRDNSVSPLFLNLVTAMQLWGLVIFAIRRADIRGDHPDASLSWTSQQVQEAGWAIMCFSETLRIGAMTWKMMTSIAAAHPHKPLVSNHIGKIAYYFTSSLMLLTALAWTITMIVMSSESLFQLGQPRPNIITQAADIMIYSYRAFVISLMIMAVMFAGNAYISLAGTRTSILSSFIVQTTMLGIWWILVWPLAYNHFASGAGLRTTMCAGLFDDNLCGLTRAVGYLGMIMFGAFVLNTIVGLYRLILNDLAAKEALPTSELARQGTTITRREAMARGTVGFGDSWISAETFTWLSLCGWLIYTFGSTSYNTTAYYIGERPTRIDAGFEIFQYTAAHFLSVALPISLFIQSHIVSNKTYRDHSHAWRYATLAALAFQFYYSIPQLILMSRYTRFGDLESSHLAALAGMAILTGSQLIQTLQFVIYGIIYPAQPVTTMMPTSNLVYDKVGNPVVGAVPIDVEKGETLNPHHDQAGLGTNYTKTDKRHQDTLSSAIPQSNHNQHYQSHDKDSLNRAPLNDNMNYNHSNAIERNTDINSNYQYPTNNTTMV